MAREAHGRARSGMYDLVATASGTYSCMSYTTRGTKKRSTGAIVSSSGSWKWTTCGRRRRSSATISRTLIQRVLRPRTGSAT